jgi:phage baseplate assembly protein W
VPRQDYAYPFALAPASGRVAEAGYADHVAQMVRQVLLTSPGERVNRPDFGAGLRRLVFAPNSDALRATAELTVRDALARWLADHVTVRTVTVSGPEAAELGQLVVTVVYELIEDRSVRRADVRVE